MAGARILAPITGRGSYCTGDGIDVETIGGGGGDRSSGSDIDAIIGRGTTCNGINVQTVIIRGRSRGRYRSDIDAIISGVVNSAAYASDINPIISSTSNGYSTSGDLRIRSGAAGHRSKPQAKIIGSGAGRSHSTGTNHIIIR